MGSILLPMGVLVFVCLIGCGVVWAKQRAARQGYVNAPRGPPATVASAPVGDGKGGGYGTGAG